MQPRRPHPLQIRLALRLLPIHQWIVRNGYKLGRETLASAMNWASDEIGHGNNLSQLVATPH